MLGGLLLDNETWDRVSERVVAQDFYSRSHRITFETVGRLIELGNPVDLITLSEALDNDQMLDDAVLPWKKFSDHKLYLAPVWESRQGTYFLWKRVHAVLAKGVDDG